MSKDKGVGGISEITANLLHDISFHRESIPSFLTKILLVCSCLISYMSWCHAVSISQQGVALSPKDSSETGLRLCGTEKKS